MSNIPELPPQPIQKHFLSTKTYTHSLGISAAFRQWRAKSHCHFIHGYALQVKMVFATDTLNENNWVQDFGGLKPIKKWLEDQFDHKTLVAQDDPKLPLFQKMAEEGIIQLNILPHIGCERFAEYIFDHVIKDYPLLVSVEVREHEGNSAICGRD